MVAKLGTELLQEQVMKSFDYRYRAQVAFVLGIVTGWFAGVPPLREVLTLLEVSPLTLRYTGNFVPPILGAFTCLILFYLGRRYTKSEAKEEILIHEKLGMGICSGLILASLLVAPYLRAEAIFQMVLPSLKQADPTAASLTMGYVVVSGLCACIGAGVAFLAHRASGKNQQRIALLLLLLALGAITGWLLLEYRTNRWLNGTYKLKNIKWENGYLYLFSESFTIFLAYTYDWFMLNEEGRPRFSYIERKAMKEWFSTFVGCGFFLMLYPIARWVQKLAHRHSFRSYGVAMTMVGIGYWYLPMGMTGVVNQSFLSYPPVLRNQFRIACLFTHQSSSWPTAHYEVLFEEEGEWREGPLEPFFPVDIFGHRTRFNRIVLASKRKNKKTKRIVGKNAIRLKEMGFYIQERWPEAFPGEPKPIKIRYTIANHPVEKKFFVNEKARENAKKGHCLALEEWSRPALKDIPKKHKRFLGTFNLQGDK